jgi:UDP-N-acetylmuramate--alanine ligase
MTKKIEWKKCHFIGIGGIGMSGLARILVGRNTGVTGSDIAASYVTEGLEHAGAKVMIGHSAQYITEDMTVIFSTEIKANNPELLEAKRLNCKMLHRSELLRQLMEGYKCLAVAGTHGKTTTSSLLASTLVAGGIDPSFAVGGIIPQFQANAGCGKGEYFVAEADESDGTFLRYDPYGAIITNIDLDHMDHYGSVDTLIDAFEQFAGKVRSAKHFFWCGDDERLKALKLPGISYGLGSDCALRVLRWEQKGWKLEMDISYQGKVYSKVEVALIGHHNVLNSLAVFGLALAVGITEEAIRSAFLAFTGVKRRCEVKGNVNDILFLDDYAHHPTEIKTTLDGIRKGIGAKRLIAIFQPHRYSRTKSCLGTFGGIFEAADELIVTDIFGAGEVPIPGLTHEIVLNEIKESYSKAVKYIPRQDLLNSLKVYLQPNDVVVTLGAGDITKLGAEIVKSLEKCGRSC